MKKLTGFNLWFLAFCFLGWALHAQEEQPIKKNLVFVEGLGNGFVDINAEAYCFATINYSRKVIFDKTSFMFSLGVGAVTEGGNSPLFTMVDFPIGILARGKYKRNGFWGGIFLIPAFGEIVYFDVSGLPRRYNKSFQFSPNLTYQYQSKSEHFFCRISFTPKILMSVFDYDKYSYGQKIFPFWGGISIGGGW